MSTWDDEAAEWYAWKYGDYPTGRLAIDQLTLDATATVVDVGCGTGAVLRHGSAQVTGGTLIGIDPVPRMVAIAREQTADHPAAGRIEIRLGSAESIPVPDHTADVVLALDSIDHWEDVARGLAEVHRVMVETGRFVIGKDLGVPREVSSDALSEMLTAVGFDVDDTIHIQAEGIESELWICGKR